MDSHCALEVDHLKEGTRLFEVRRPKFEEGCPEVSIREGPEESVYQCRSHCGGQLGTAALG